ncbi:hypothetical protein HYS00_03075 [Candidatus Microgenomates bacterium]|nr:hypothetical protein [Candidatus Microgenomates bacterium]
MKHSITFYHLFFAALLLTSIVILIVLIPPTTIWLVALLIFLISLTSFYITALITPNKNTRILVALFSAAFLGMNAAIGFNVINTALLVSFIIGLKLLLK